MTPIIVMFLLAATAPLQPPPNSPAGSDPITTLSRRLERTRGLLFKHPVPSRHLSVDAAATVIAEIVERDAPKSDMRSDQLLLAALGLIPPDYDLYRGTLALLSDQVAGFYDPYSKQFVIVDFPDNHPMKAAIDAAGDSILIHELDHALTDQQFDILKMLGTKQHRDRDDQLMARRALAEGDATLAMMLDALEQAGSDPKPETFPLEAMVEQIAQASVAASPALQQSPQIVRAAVIEPYRLGLRYVGEAWKRGGWAAVDALWKSPPNSTEQLLHADKQSDAPQRISASSAPAKSRLVASTELGELGVSLLLATKSAADVAERAAAGWDGDLVELFHDDKGQARIRLTSIWDTASDVEEFAAALSAVCGCTPPAASDTHRLIVEWTP